MQIYPFQDIVVSQFHIPAFQESSSCMPASPTSFQIWGHMAVFPVSRGQAGRKNSLQKGDRFSVLLFTRVGARDAACGFGFGPGFGYGLAMVSVTRRVGCRYSGRNRVSVTVEMVPVTPRTLRHTASSVSICLTSGSAHLPPCQRSSFGRRPLQNACAWPFVPRCLHGRCAGRILTALPWVGPAIERHCRRDLTLRLNLIGVLAR